MPGPQEAASWAPEGRTAGAVQPLPELLRRRDVIVGLPETERSRGGVGPARGPSARATAGPQGLEILGQHSPAERARLEDVRLVRPKLLAEELTPEGAGGKGSRARPVSARPV